jgi:hypothetical protein
MTRLSFAVALLAGSLLSGAAWAEMVKFHATLNSASEVPPKQTAGKGEATATLDTATKTLTYEITFSGLTGPATMGHFHGPAAAGANAGVVVPFANPVTSPIKGTATLTEAQIADLMAGKWYVNIHTAANPPGEIRGQMMHAM